MFKSDNKAQDIAARYALIFVLFLFSTNTSESV